MIAHYSGDGTFGSSDSAAVNVTVTPEAKHHTLSVLTSDANDNPVPFTGGPYGSFIYPRADVSAQSGYGIPSGDLELTDGRFGIGSFQLNSEGNAAAPHGYTSLGPGPHSLVAFTMGTTALTPASRQQPISTLP